MLKIVVLSFLALTSLSNHAFADRFDTYSCYLKDNCPRGAICAEPGLTIWMDEDQVVGVKDKSSFNLLTIESFSVKNDIAIVRGRQDYPDDSFTMKIYLKSMNHLTKSSGTYRTSKSGTSKVFCNLE